MEDRRFILLGVIPLFFSAGCKSSFNHLSKEISKSYSNRELAEYDLLYNHPSRIKVKKDNWIDNYNIQKDTIVFVQYTNWHYGKSLNVIILGGKIISPNSDANQHEKIDTDILSSVFLNAIVNWDTAYINAVPEEPSFHKGVLYITRIVQGKIEILRPRSYAMKK